MDINCTLGTIGVGVDGGPCRTHLHGQTPSIASFANVASVPPGFGGFRSLLEELDRGDQSRINAMLLSLVLDLWRRNEYAYVALKDYVQYADPEASARIKVHSDILAHIDTQIPVDWSHRAEVCNAIVHRLLGETEAHHDASLANAASTAASQIGPDELRRLAQFLTRGATHGSPPNVRATAVMFTENLERTVSENRKRVDVSLKGHEQGGLLVEGTPIALNASGEGHADVLLIAPTVDVNVTVYASTATSYELSVTINGRKKQGGHSWPGGLHTHLYQFPFSDFELPPGGGVA